MANGCKLGWLINPGEEKTTVYFNGAKQVIGFHEKLSGNNIVAGFEIQLSLLPKA